jgi:hypothetical protein
MRTRPSNTASAFLATSVLALTMLTGCSSGPLDTSCSEFNEKSEAEQIEIATEWNKDAVGEEMAEMGAAGVRDSMLTYCADEAHADDKVGDLEYSFGG